MAKAWELKRIWVGVENAVTVEEGVDETRTFRTWDTYLQSDAEDEGWDEAVIAAAEGWELVSTVPFIAGHEKHVADRGSGSSYTEGYWLLFKREKGQS